MTVPALFGYGGHSTFHRSSSVPPSASDRGDLWKHGGGSGGWHSQSTKGVSSAAMSALTLLVFLFFLNILQSCLQDMTFNQQTPPYVTVMTAPAVAPASTTREEPVTMMAMPAMVPMSTPSYRRSGRQKRGDPRELTLVRKEFVQLPRLPSSPIKRLENPIAAAVINQRLQHLVSAEMLNHHVTNPPETVPHHVPLELLTHRLQNHGPTTSEVPAHHLQQHGPTPPEVTGSHYVHHVPTPPEVIHHHGPTRSQALTGTHVPTPQEVIPPQHLHYHHPIPPPVSATTERLYIQVPLVAPGHRLQHRVEEVEEVEEYEDEPSRLPSSTAAPNIIFVRPIVPIAASFRQLAWRAFNAISRPLVPLLTLWRSGRGGDGASAEMCCSMLMCELERIRESGGTFRIRLAQILRGLTTWSCPTDSSLYHEDSDCKALITECIERTGRHTTYTTLASLLERYVP